jgi:hypothetical protein
MRHALPLAAAVCTAAPGAVRADRGAGAADSAAAPPPAAQTEKKERDEHGKGGVDIDAELEVVYTSNVFREQSRRLDNFDSDGGTGERFEGMEGPADVYARPALEIGWSRKISSGRRLKLSAGAALTAFARNSIANYFTLEAAASNDFTKHDRISLEIEFIPRRFKENYFNDVGGDKVFDQAIYRQVAPALAYRREWSKRWSTELEYELALRSFQDPFAHRDSTTHSFELLLARQLSGHATVKLGPELALAHVANHMEFGAEVDRSHRDLGVVGSIELDLPHGWAGEVELEYKHKTYLSADPADDTHYQRADDAFEADFEVQKRLTRTWYLSGLLGFSKVLSNRDDPSIDADEVGYTELVAGAGGQARF